MKSLRILLMCFASLLFGVLCESEHEREHDMPVGMRTSELPDPKSANTPKETFEQDDPDDLWDEWGETEESRKFPKRQREITEGMDIYSVMGNIMKQNKVFYAHFNPSLQVTREAGRALVSRFGNMLTAGGVSCMLWFVEQPAQIVAKTPSVRDAYLAKDFLVDQPEVQKVIIDNVPFTPKPQPDDDDDDGDEDDQKQDL